MPFFVKKLIAIGMLMLLCSAAIADEGIKQWQEPYLSLIKQSASAPQTALEQMNSMTISKDTPVVFAQYHNALSMVYYALVSPHKALEHASLALQVIDKERQPWLFHMTKLNEAQAFDLVGTPSKGLIGANAALIWGELQQDIDLTVNALAIRGTLRNSLVDYQGALNDLQKAYDLAPNTESLHRSSIASMLALVYEYRGEDDMAIPFFEEAVTFHENSGQWVELSIALYGLGKANKHIGNISTAQEQLTRSKDVSQSVGDTQGVAYALKELAGIAIIQGSVTQARAMLLEALTIFQSANNVFMLFDVNLRLFELAMDNDHLKEAQQFLDASKSYLKQADMPLQKIDLDESTARYLALQGHYKAAFELLYNTVIEKSSQYNAHSTQQLHRLRSQYEVDLKQQENELLEKRNQSQQTNLAHVETQNLQLLLLFGATLVICMLLIVLAKRSINHRRKFEQLANVDGLTGLANRRCVLKRLESEIALAQRHNTPLSVAIVDIDLFKSINDTFGHAVGDQVLIAFAKLCLDTFRQSDVVGRIGGEEFLIVLPQTQLSEGTVAFNQFRGSVKALTSMFEHTDLRLSVSVGLTCWQPGDTVQSLMLQCDQALYRAKGSGRDKVETFNPSDPSLQQLQF